MEVTIQKGSRIRAEWFKAEPFDKAALTGMQIKTTATAISITGVVRHIRSPTPDFNPATTEVFVEPDDGTGMPCAKCGVNEVQIKLTWIVEVISL